MLKQKQYIRAILKEPSKPPEVIIIENTLSALQKAVGGHIEVVSFASDACFICNEEGRLLGLEPNAELLGVDFVGNVLCVGVRGEGFCDLPQNGIQLLLREMGADPEVGRRISHGPLG